MKDFLDRFGPWALVTGASSGIGEAFAHGLAERGMNLVLVARRKEKLRELADKLNKVQTRVVVANLSHGGFLPTIERSTDDLEIGLLVNNAGVATTGNFLDNDLDSELALLNVNDRAPLILAHHFGRLMRSRGRGGMIFVASTVAFAGVPLLSNYAASKAYDLVFAEGLARELQSVGISVQALCPGPTSTDLWPSGAKLAFPMHPHAVVETALNNLGRITTVIPGWTNRLIAASTRTLPRSWNARIFGRVIGGMLKDSHSPAASEADGWARRPSETTR